MKDHDLGLLRVDLHSCPLAPSLTFVEHLLQLSVASGDETEVIDVQETADPYWLAAVGHRGIRKGLSQVID